MYELSKLILAKHYVPIIGGGKARWNNVHVRDLSELYLLLTEAALGSNAEEELWGRKGYVVVENGEHTWGELARHIGSYAIALGCLESAEEKAFSKDEALETAGFEAVSWGLNSRACGKRARKVLGWKPKMHGLYEEVPTILKAEQARLQERR